MRRCTRLQLMRETRRRFARRPAARRVRWWTSSWSPPCLRVGVRIFERMLVPVVPRFSPAAFYARECPPRRRGRRAAEAARMARGAQDRSYWSRESEIEHMQPGETETLRRVVCAENGWAITTSGGFGLLPTRSEGTRPFGGTGSPRERTKHEAAVASRDLWGGADGRPPVQGGGVPRTATLLSCAPWSRLSRRSVAQTTWRSTTHDRETWRRSSRVLAEWSRHRASGDSQHSAVGAECSVGRGVCQS